MKLTFKIKESDKLLSVEGKITAWFIEASAASLTMLKLQADLINHRISKDADITPIVQLPGLLGDGWVRVSNATDYDLRSKVFSRKGTLVATFHVCGFYSSYEDACAAEMKTRMGAGQ